MDDDDDRDLRDVIGDVQALNDFLHGPGSQEIDEDDLLGSACTIDNSNSLFADAISADPTSSTKDTHNHIGEESSRLQLASSLNVLEELDTSSPLSNLNGDQPFDILQKSLQEANITQQTLQEEADLAAGITSTQDFSQTSHHAASFSQVSQLPSGTSTVRGLTQQQMNVTPAPILQQVLRTPFVNNETNVQPGFFQQMGINSVAIQHVPSSNQAGGIGPIQLISSLDTQQPPMTLNHLEGSHFISKSSGQPPAINPVPVGGYNMSSLPNQQQMSLSTSGLNETGGLLLQRRVTALNGNTYCGTSNIGQVPQPMSVHFSGNNIQTALPLHNIIIQRGPVPSQPKISLSIQPKPAQMNQQQTVYNVNNLELQTAFKIQNEVALQQQQIQHGLPFCSTNAAQSSSVGPSLGVNIAKQQAVRKSIRPQVLNQTGNSIIIHPPIAQHEPLVSQNQFFIPTSLALNMNSTVPHLQTANGQILQNRTVSTQLVSNQVASECVLANRNSSGTVLATQSFSGQFLNSQNSAGQLVSSQNGMEQVVNASGGQLLTNNGSTQLVTGQVPLHQTSQMVFNFPTTQGVQPTAGGSSINTGIFKQSGQNAARGKSLQNQLTVSNTPSSVCSSYVSTVQPVISASSCGDHVTQMCSSGNIVMVCQGEQSLVTVESAQQHPQCQQQLGMNQIYRISNPYHQNAGVMQPSRQVVFSRTDMPVTQTSNHQQFLYSQAPKKMMATSKHQPVTNHSLASLGQLSSQVSASVFGSQTLPSSVSKIHSNNGIQQPRIPNLLNNTGIHNKTTCAAVQMNDSQLHKTAGTLQQHLGQLHPLQDKMIGLPEMQKISQFEGQNVGQKRPASKQLTKESLILQQLQEEQRNVLQPDYKTPFISLQDAMQRLLPYHVFQGNLPSQEEFLIVDNEFEDVSVQLLKRTQMMLSKYRSLLLEDAMRVNPSAEMVMIDRVFNQDEKASLIQDKRLALEDSDGYLAKFCCSSTVLIKSVPETQPLTADMMLHKSLASSSSQSTPANATINQKNDSSRLVHLASSATTEVKATTNSPTNSPCVGKSYSSSRALKLTIEPETSYGTGTQSKSSKTQERSDTGNHGGKVTIGSTPGSAQTQSTKVCEPAVEAVQVREGDESMSDVEEKHNNSCDKVIVEDLMKEAPDTVINKISDPIKLEHDERDSQLPWHDQSQNRNAKSSQLQDLTCVQTKEAKEAQCDTSLHEHLESAINSILDLQQAHKPSDNAVIKNDSPETPHFSALAPVENYVDKCIPDHNEGIRETDSILEAAVNSILEC
ncbi:BRD4-interacting chromatin-remodeling complex-associated protein-like [Stegostoma tigrinum]|uniref:BRD4-interacting chromatin-remodeling complex-associated protein-like n=1 Tax=Stegostoma tigrinum TaxID=3053191 RepID=UPI00202B1A31|nr:BRD4-interacting chromatin-remodeling complex-associated protein-like [Stegostoma tigrinum]XP_048392749.1 BRD4-interacting chromatin-remodeling complex-associated protein-like [Stegostoma tigrinum]